MIYDAKQLSFLLRQWASGNLDNILDNGHAIAGVNKGVVVTHRGLAAQRPAERFTAEDVDRVIQQMLVDNRPYAVLLICVYLLGWTVDRCARAMDFPSSSIAMSHLIQAQDLFAQTLFNHP